MNVITRREFKETCFLIIKERVVEYHERIGLSLHQVAKCLFKITGTCHLRRLQSQPQIRRRDLGFSQRDRIDSICPTEVRHSNDGRHRGFKQFQLLRI